ncbi:hypothetical protein DAMDJJ_24215 [Cupriavidus necator]
MLRLGSLAPTLVDYGFGSPRRGHCYLAEDRANDGHDGIETVQKSYPANQQGAFDGAQA